MSASAQKADESWDLWMREVRVAHALTNTIQVPSVTRLMTPIASSAVEWSARASSRV